MDVGLVGGEDAPLLYRREPTPCQSCVDRVRSVGLLITSGVICAGTLTGTLICKKQRVCSAATQFVLEDICFISAVAFIWLVCVKSGRLLRCVDRGVNESGDRSPV